MNQKNRGNVLWSIELGAFTFEESVERECIRKVFEERGLEVLVAAAKKLKRRGDIELDIVNEKT